MAKTQLSWFIFLLALTGSHVAFGVPLADGSSSNAMAATTVSPTTATANIDNINGTGTGDDGGLILFQQTTRTGLLSDLIIQQMVQQCGGDIDPAVAFYGCIENTTQLPSVWAAMGLNATFLRLRTIEIFRLVQSNLTEDKNTFVSLLTEGNDASNSSTPASASASQASSNNSLLDFFNTVSTQSENLCMNVDGLLSCLNPYLTSCFPDLDSNNDLSQQDSSTSTMSSSDTSSAIAQAQTDNSSMNTSTLSDDDSDDSSDSSSDNDSDANGGDDDNAADSSSFFQIPFLLTQSQVFPILQQAFSNLCDQQAAPLKNLIVTLPCLLQSIDQATQPCETVCQNVQATIQNATESVTGGGSSVNPGACISLRNCLECQLDMATQTCGQDVAMQLQQLAQIYFNNLQCIPNSEDSSNGDNIVRAPFNVGIL